MGFEEQFKAGSTYVSTIRERHGVPELASQQDMKSTIMKLLRGRRNSHIDDAVTLAVNQRVDSSSHLGSILAILKMNLKQVSLQEKYVFLMKVVKEWKEFNSV